ncbi:MAG: hypothetical protein OXC12_07340, partial [Spirochaetaceae bacterium]|nr:hypothetical protein [Spirochaetaceae bacterium]
PVLFGDLAAAVAVAGREFRSLAGEAPSAPLAWAVRLSGTGRPRQWRGGGPVARGGGGGAGPPRAGGAAAAEPPWVELAVTPAVPLGALTVSGEGAVTAGAAGAVPTLALQVRARPGSVSVRWRGARGGDTLQVRAAAEASAVAVEAGWRVANEEITTQLAVEVRLSRGRLRIAAAGLGEPMPDGPRLTVTMSVES